ncbi:MAG: nucleotidyl transferase AbiEii/AbiGii toxin family protein [Rubrivivax sp.]|nr:nucleotidyl transferase AbiEii/AbiGii toxin family protein [Rubrivivax sp.]
MTAPAEDEVLGLLRAKAALDGEALDRALHRHLLQRLVAWVASSALRKRLILKGALLLDVFNDPKHQRRHRHTQCADFLAVGPIEPVAIQEALTEVHGDNLVGASFDLDSLSIRAAPPFRGVRTSIARVIGRVHDRWLPLAFRLEHFEGRAPEHTDVFVHPVVSVPSMPHPRPLAITEEAAMAERVESLYWCGARGVRFEDFVDLRLLIEATSVDPAEVSDALGEAFVRRKLPLPTSLPASLHESFLNDPEVAGRWERFLQRERGVRGDKKGARAKRMSAEEQLSRVAGTLADRVSAWLAGLPTRPAG